MISDTISKIGKRWNLTISQGASADLRGRSRYANSRILADEEVVLTRKDAFLGKYPERMRRIRALVVVDGKEREMEFLTNNMG